MTQEAKSGFVDLTVDIVSAYVSNNSVPVGELSALIGQVHAALRVLTGDAPVNLEVVKPAVSIRKSVTPDYLISLEDGKRYKSLKRHLSIQYGLTPNEYRAKWGLPNDYPMVAPNYAAMRSAMAKATGLGRNTTGSTKPAPKKRSRKNAVTDRLG